jgi:Protein of unknown function (DUF4013)
MDDLVWIVVVNNMDYENMLRDSFAYAKEGVFEKINRWVLLIVATLILTIPLLGYLAKILRAEKPAPEVQDWGKLFVDGIKMLIVEIIYFIPVIILWVIAMVVMGAGRPSGYGQYGAYGAYNANPTAAMTGMAGAGILGLVILILEIIIGVILPIALIRFARSGSFGDAFNFNAILGHIGKIGWVSYIIALIIAGVVVGVPVFIIMFIIGAIVSVALGLSAIMVLPVIMGIIYLIIVPLISVFLSRYITLVYDSVAA